jgi:hypothetical protein
LNGDLLLIAISLVRIATDESIKTEIPEIDDHLGVFEERLRQDSIEEAITGLYIILHKTGSIYSEQEKLRIKLKGGYLCYPGGLSPIRIASTFIKGDTIVADLGSGNGLQGLLLQQLYPHKRTLQIEISSELIRIGKLYQNALGIDETRVKWINDDIMNASFEEADIIYIYRPARPAEGCGLYRDIGERLTRQKKDITIFSIADCLSPYLGNNFYTCYDDGHLKIFVNHEVSFSADHSRSEGLPYPS